MHALGAGADEVGELLVVDQRGGRLAAQDVGDLGAGEGGVEVELAGAELRARDGRLDEPAVVAAHDRDAVPFAYAGGGEPVRERVGAALDLGERERPALVDEGEAIGAADRADGVRGGGVGPPALQRAHRAQRAVGALDFEHARPEQRAGDFEAILDRRAHRPLIIPRRPIAVVTARERDL